MGCGLRKLEDPEDSSPGKIYSTLKRPQVEIKTDTVYEYVLLDFSLEGSRPTVQYVSSLCELSQALQPYYTQGYVLTTLHPIILSVGRTRSLPFSLLYRAILARPRPSKQVVSMCHSVPVLRVEEWPIPGESLTDDTVRALIDRVNSSARGGVRFVGSVLQQAGGGGSNGRVPSPRRGYRSPPHTPPCTPPGEGELEDHSPTYSPDLRLLVFFHSWAPGCAPLEALACQYHQGALSMRVSRKGQVVSALEADWLELTAAYYRKGWSLVDSFVYWDTPKGEPVPRSLEGLFVYEERSTAPPANDTIVVEQWTVIEGSDVKTDYGPLLHTLAEFGWLLTCVLPTPIIRHDRLCVSSDGNLATKQVVFLQRPVKTSSVPQRNQAGSMQRDVATHSVSRGVGSPRTHPTEELSPTAGGIGGFPVFGGGYPSALSHLEEGGFEQDDGAAEVTCM
ncbi:raftlin-2 isoform X1 [Oncorhynchus tshawytscha]|uniref:raftlin-2 isoform X1 n=1 Tax=Oncorhynchus tshawytscha TaxID=74940 RepID=UPI000D0A6430|nr:raftlin-2 isoform X1 [Oncorhynchus tshawytscha]XP_029491880.1 raftlin-2-like isoform X1 [Oncorhynchus nerka]XP_031652422.1 raftlin-2 isoform X1 [Oncorhynchus kisutch]